MSSPSNKRHFPEENSPVLPPEKKQAIAADEEVAVAPPPPPVHTSEVKKSNFIIYPPYDDFEVSRISLEKDTTSCRQGGELKFIRYHYATGDMDHVGPLLIQTPKDLFTPTGCNSYGNGSDEKSMSLLISMGNDWESNTDIKKFVEVIGAIHVQVAKLMKLAKFHVSENEDPQKVCDDKFNPIIFVGMKKDTDEPYPPSMKVSVNITGTNKSQIFQEKNLDDGRSAIVGVPPCEVRSSSTLTSVVNIQWVFARRQRNSWAFNLKCTMFQAIVKPAGELNEGDVCNVCR